MFKQPTSNICQVIDQFIDMNINQETPKNKHFLTNQQNEIIYINNQILPIANTKIEIIQTSSNTSQTQGYLQEILNQFIKTETVQNCPQRSEQWYQLRLNSFGGSEIADLMGTNKYKSLKQFLKEKLNTKNGILPKSINLQSRNIMDWGSFFEGIHRKALEFKFNTNIQESSLSQGKHLLKGCHQSPDGLSVVQTSILQENAYFNINLWNDKKVFNKENLTVLWEQKCPSFRDPTPETVPENYIGQVKLGLSIFKVCDIACFSDSVIRICNVQQFETKTFNTGIIKKRTSLIKDSEPLYIGFIDITEAAQQLSLPKGDISSQLTDQTFNLLFEIQRTGQPFKYEVFPYSELESVKQTLEAFKGTFICWKLVNLTAVLVEKSQFFENILSLFIVAGHQALEDSSKLTLITTIAKYIKTQKLQFTAENTQDSWYLTHKTQLETLANAI